jgi:hypothetical protein
MNDARTDVAPIVHSDARQRALRFSRRITPDADLLAELDERMNLLARYQADLEAGQFTECSPGQLHGGIAYERFHIEAIVSELEGRERARAHGYRRGAAETEPDLPARFASARTIDVADVIADLTGNPGKRSGDRRHFACPFHVDATPSLVTYPGERGWYCFSCNRGGDAIRFVMELQAVGAVEALRLLEASAVGVRVPA